MLSLSSNVYSNTYVGGMIHFYGAIIAAACHNIVNDNMLETNCWDNNVKVATHKISMVSLTSQQNKSLIKYGETRFL